MEKTMDRATIEEIKKVMKNKKYYKNILENCKNGD
jgi:hypothetical protein